MYTSRFLKLFLVGLTVFLVACGSNKRKELKPVKLSSFEKQVKVEKLWSRKAGSGQGEYYHQFTLAMDRAFIYSASEDGKVFKYDKFKGKKQWKVSLDMDLTAGVEVDEKHVYLAAGDGSIIALDKTTGEQAWSMPLEAEVVSAPKVHEGHLVIMTVDGGIVSLDPENGNFQWRYDTTMPALSLRGNSRTTDFSGMVLAGSTNGKVVALDLETGLLRWDPKVADASGDTDLERVVDVDSTPLVAKNMMIAVSFQGRVMAYDLSSGRPVWASEESSYQDIGEGYGNVYITSDQSELTAYDQENGDIKWVQEGLLRRKLTAPSSVGPYLAVADYKGYLHLLSQLNGSFAARKRVAYESVRAPILVEDDRFYVLADNGRIKAYQLGRQLD